MPLRVVARCVGRGQERLNRRVATCGEASFKDLNAALQHAARRRPFMHTPYHGRWGRSRMWLLVSFANKPWETLVYREHRAPVWIGCHGGRLEIPPKAGGSGSHRFSLTNTPSVANTHHSFFMLWGQVHLLQMAFGRARLRYWLSQKGTGQKTREAAGLCAFSDQKRSATSPKLGMRKHVLP